MVKNKQVKRKQPQVRNKQEVVDDNQDDINLEKQEIQNIQNKRKSPPKQHGNNHKFQKEVNKLGNTLLSKSTLKFLYECVKSHVDILNFVIKNIDSKTFWIEVNRTSLMLTSVSFALSLVYKTTLNFEFFGIFYIISFIVIEINLRNVNVLKLNLEDIHYTEINKKETIERSEPLTEEVETEQPKPKPKIKFRGESELEKELPIIEENKTSHESVMSNIRNKHKEMMEKKNNTFDDDFLDEVLDSMPDVKNKMVYNSTIEQIQFRQNLIDGMKRSKASSKMSQEDLDKYTNLLI